MNMAFKVKFSEQAADDLSKIIRYISEELCNPQAAENFYSAVDKRLETLSENPYVFSLYHDERLSEQGIRFAVVGNYLMFYVVDDDKPIVSIARILYEKQDIPAVFEKSGF
jgi:addiction module RelE/StbE family toxin